MLNGIVSNRTVYMYKVGFGINDLQWLKCHKTKKLKYRLQFLSSWECEVLLCVYPTRPHELDLAKVNF